ncbi:hypothetical protein EXIGLDRAFT_831623 [Exidia glandulosa HHB12029]|uniref:Actin-like ATPase domain-containing protein n=1 Tax=Exidia glandulosa HHB12029 TaxID=1314781 RepID=A0A165MHZ4_EXIGL|nr:hypothetical protein EXIGLDRAFT_831623 [Exidia glandulosa HHB12029]
MYNGDEKLVIAVDLGTTNSGISFAHLQPGAAPRVRSVTRWPGQEDAAGDSKIPTLVRYKEGKPIAFGADAVDDPDVEGGPVSYLASWFKLHLHPSTMRSSSNIAVPPLPPKITLKQVYADFLSFIFKHAVEFFTTSAHDGERIWSRLNNTVVIILATPNGWDSYQQGFLHDAIVVAGVLPQGFEPDRLQFVTEAEASVHYALEHTRGGEWLTAGAHFAVLDAGGSTVDTTVYRCVSTTPKVVLEEVTGSECVQAGSVFVNRDAERLLKLKLANSKFNDSAFISAMLDVFERKTKRRFDGSDEASVIAFGRMQDNDPSCDISRGRLTMTSDEVKLAFQNSLADIMDSCARIIERSPKVCDTVLLVGGYSDSAYLRATLREKFAIRGIQFITADDSTKKAAAEGATSWYTKQLVQARAVRAHFGISLNEFFRDSKRSLKLESERPEAKYIAADGKPKIGPILSIVAKKHEVISVESRKTFKYAHHFASKPDIEEMRNCSMTIFAFDADTPPDWVYVRHSETKSLSPGVRRVCEIVCDLSTMYDGFKSEVNPKGQEYWTIEYEFEVSFGTNSLQAEVQWKVNNVYKKSPLQAIPGSFV